MFTLVVELDNALISERGPSCYRERWKNCLIKKMYTRYKNDINMHNKYYISNLLWIINEAAGMQA